MSLVLDLLKRVGFEFGQVLMNDVILRNVYFTPWTSEKETTVEAIDGDGINTDVDTYTKLKQQQYEVRGYLQEILAFSEKHKTDFETIREMFKDNSIVNLIGTDFDDKNFLIVSVSKLEEGMNFIEFSIRLKEVIFAEVKTFTTENKNISQVNDPKKNNNVAKVKNSNIPLVPY